MPPSDPRLRQMNDAQWLWCYMNAMQDKEEEEKMWKTRLDYVGWYIDPERAKSVMEEDEAAAEAENNNTNKTIIKEGVYNNDDFMLEAQAAKLGYDPSSGLTPAEFIQQHLESQKQDQNVDIMNDDFDKLLASGEFVNVTNADNSVGNRKESESDFLSRVASFQDFADESFKTIGDPIPNMDTPIGLEEDDLHIVSDTSGILIEDLLGDDGQENSGIYFDTKNIKNYDSNDDEESQNEKPVIKDEEIKSFNDMSPEEFKAFLKEHGLTEDDIDIIETPEDDE